MRIAVTSSISWPYVRRGNRISYELAVHLAARGHDVHYITPTPGSAARDERTQGLHVHWVPLRDTFLRTALKLQKMLTFVAPCVRLLRELEVDVVQATYPVDAYAASRHRARTGTPFAYLIYDCLPFHPEMRLGKRMFERALATADRVAVISAFVQRELRRAYGVNAEVLPLPVDTAQFAMRGAPPAGPPRILCTASLLEPRKRVDLLVRAFDRLRDTVPDAVLQLSGHTDGARTRALLDLVRPQHRDAVQVLGVGAVADLPELYRSAAITVLPSVQEALGLVMLESLSCGTPVVATRSGAIPEVLDDPRIGLLFEPDAGPDAVAHALAQGLLLARDPSTASRCRAHIEQRYSWPILGPRFEHQYLSLQLAPAPAPARDARNASRARPEPPRRLPPPTPAPLDSLPISSDTYFEISWHLPRALYLADWLHRHHPHLDLILLLSPFPDPFHLLLARNGTVLHTRPQRDTTYDAIVCDDAPALDLASLARSLAPDGVLLVTAPRFRRADAASTRDDLARATSTAATGTSRQSLRARLTGAGFTVRELRWIVGRTSVRPSWGSIPIKSRIWRTPLHALQRVVPCCRDWVFAAAHLS